MMDHDPYNLFPQQTQAKTKSNNLLLGIVIGVALTLLWFKAFPNGIPDGFEYRDQDRQEQNDNELNGDIQTLIIVEETGDRRRFPHLAILINDDKFWDELESQGVKMRLYEIDSPSAVPFRDAAKEAGLPAILGLDANKKILKSKTIPPSKDGILDFLR